jgi:D-lactate dehydrogenase
VLEEEAALSEEAELISSEFRRKVNFETLVMDHVLVHHPRVIVTPHNAFNSREAIHTILTTTLENINSFLKDAPINTISV